MLKISKSGATPGEFVIEGILDETLTSEMAMKSFGDDAFKNGEASLHLEGIHAGNSSGLFHFINFLRSIPGTVTLESVPVWMVWQLNMIHELLSENVRVASIQAEYYCEQLDRASIFVLKVGSDIPLLEDYSDFTPPIRERDGNTYRGDFDDTYLSFLTFWKGVLERKP